MLTTVIVGKDRVMLASAQLREAGRQIPDGRVRADAVPARIQFFLMIAWEGGVTDQEARHREQGFGPTHSGSDKMFF